jgi:uncharacterized protein with NRDE domain
MQGAEQTLRPKKFMCTIALLIQVVDGAALVVAANRDEFYARETRAPEILVASPRTIGGVDVEKGGTWLAVRREGRFAAVTNQRAMVVPPIGLASRGHAVRELAVADDPDAFVAALDPTAYASMNLLWGDARGVSVAYLRREAGTREIVRLPPGVHVVCNDRLGAPGFPRGERMRAGVVAALARDATWPAIAAALPALLADHTHETPTLSCLAPELERELTATCIHSPRYGTRSSTIIGVDRDRVVGYLHADGPPCTTPFLDRTELLR